MIVVSFQVTFFLIFQLFNIHIRMWFSCPVTLVKKCDYDWIEMILSMEKIYLKNQLKMMFKSR